MSCFKISNKKIKDFNFFKILYFNYCEDGLTADNFDDHNQIVKKLLGVELANVKFVNHTNTGWRWTGYPTVDGRIFVITGHYGNLPKGAIHIKKLVNTENIENED